MDAGLKAWAEIVRQVYPDLPILRDRTQWLAGSFERPSVFIETDLVSDKVHTPRADRIIEDVGLVFHFDKERMTEEDEGEPIPFDLTPFFTFLRKRRFCYSSQRFGVALVIEPPRTRPEKDRIEVTFRYSYLLAVPKDPVPKINEFYIAYGKERTP
ncbi:MULTISPECIES: hypothetical protein [Paenibacillus]|jgi:hypothetical protein|uniref:hypothetical protein n=1 Tax=Paenibacillus TaxID=44249 RepID=UPI00240D75B4|nr:MULTISPECIES: hypothetical protein [Paenibacillus]MCI1776573.1 hypothetical protein [Paenibacillus lautus]WFB57598.1 hypothetical protein P0X86_27125 [Paenibacillus sp. BR1-192]